MKRFLVTGSILALLTLSACGTNEGKKSTTIDEVPEAIEVDLSVPKTANVGDEVFFTAVVTQGGEIVEDADEVKFEVKNISSGEKEMLEASLNEDKHYEIKYTFKTISTYDVTSHVQARGLHTMPTKQIAISDSKE